MRIHTRDTVLHGRVRLEADESYDVPDELGTYLVSMGWATDAAGQSGERAAGPVEVSPDSVTHVTKEA